MVYPITYTTSVMKSVTQIIPTSGTIRLDNCLITSNTSNTFLYTSAGNNFEITNCYILGVGYAIRFSSSANYALLTGTVAKYCSSLYYFEASYGNKTDGGTASYCAYGVYMSGQVRGTWVKNLTTNNSTQYGVLMSDTTIHQIFVEKWNSTNDRYGFAVLQQYVHTYRLTNCNFTTPTNYAAYIASNYDTLYMFNCTIDGASSAKFIYNPQTSYGLIPQYVLDGCSGSTHFPDGQYWSYWNVVKSNAEYRTQPPSLQWTNNTTITRSQYPTKLWSTYAESGKAYTITYYLKAGTGWSGTIEPIIMLGGTVIKSETVITSLTTDWVQYTASVSAEQVTYDGDLDIGFICLCNTVNFWFDDFTVVES